MTARKLTLATLLLALVCTGGCPACLPPDICLTRNDNGTTVDREVGQNLRLSLAKQIIPAQWDIVELDPNVLESVSRTYVAPNTLFVGTPGTDRFNFTASGVGTTTLRLEYHSIIDPNAAAIDTFEITVNVTASSSS
jgi:predicted secreted protein